MSKKYTFHSDYGHAWLAVKRTELEQLAVINSITSYSYVSKTGKTVYLEEDCDAGVFIRAKAVEDNTTPHDWMVLNCKEGKPSKRSFIRSLNRFIYNQSDECPAIKSCACGGGHPSMSSGRLFSLTCNSCGKHTAHYSHSYAAVNEWNRISDRK